MPICYKAAAIGQSLIDGQEVHKVKAPKPGKHDLCTYMSLSLVIYSLSKIVILHGLLESPNMRKCYQLLVSSVLTIKKQ